MTSRSDELRLDPHPHGLKSVTMWGMFGLIAIEIVVFSGLMAIYYYLRLYNDEWPIGGFDAPGLLLPSINTGVLILSSVAMFIGDRAIKRGDVGRLVLFQSLALVLGAVFLALKVIEYSGYEYTWATNAYGSIVWTMTGFHSAHVVSVVLKGLVVLGMALKGIFSAERHLAVDVNGFYWHFVVVIWIPLYITMYITPRL
jgi:heme/copper-type cytochrome/quinol oxidase subunit 3